MSKLELLRSFQSSITDFFNDLTTAFPHEEDLQIMRIFLIQQISIDVILQQFVKFVLPYKAIIQKRDEKFFLEDTGVFSTLQKDKGDKILHFKKIWTSPEMDKENKEKIFEWFDLFIKYVEKITGK